MFKHIILPMIRNSDFTRLKRVFVLSVASFYRTEIPSVAFQEFDYISNPFPHDCREHLQR